jgi:hypothetical protein
MNVEPPETLVIIESIVYKSNGFAINRRARDKRYNPKKVRRAWGISQVIIDLILG